MMCYLTLVIAALCCPKSSSWNFKWYGSFEGFFRIFRWSQTLQSNWRCDWAKTFASLVFKNWEINKKVCGGYQIKGFCNIAWSSLYRFITQARRLPVSFIYLYFLKFLIIKFLFRDWCLSRQIKWGHDIPMYYHVNHPESWVSALDLEVIFIRIPTFNKETLNNATIVSDFRLQKENLRTGTKSKFNPIKKLCKIRMFWIHGLVHHWSLLLYHHGQT